LWQWALLASFRMMRLRQGTFLSFPQAVLFLTQLKVRWLSHYRRRHDSESRRRCNMASFNHRTLLRSSTCKVLSHRFHGQCSCRCSFQCQRALYVQYRCWESRWQDWSNICGTIVPFFWALLFVPETKNRSYEELDALFERRVATRDFAKSVC
jgi:hypothetical protein